MSLRLRKSFSPIPGVRITLSPKGISTSIGAGPLRFTAGPQGNAVTSRIPGTGISYRHKLGAASGKVNGTPASFLDDDSCPIPTQPEPASSAQGMSAIASEGTGMLTTPGLQDLLELMETSRKQNAEIQRELEYAQKRHSLLSQKVTGWTKGILLKHIRKQRFASLKEEASDADIAVAKLTEMKRQSALQVEIDAPAAVMSSFHKMCDQFAVMAQSKMVWDTTMARSANKIAERTTAARIVERKPVKLQLRKCPLMDSAMPVPHFENANGGDIYIYPNFAIYFLSEDRFALLEIKDLNLSIAPTTFIEEEHVPEDCKVIGQTWSKTNKDGSPDRRFANNYQIPIVKYGKILLHSSTGMNEEYLISNAEAALAFFSAWQHFSGNVTLVAEQ